MKRYLSSAFTLVELLIVIALLGVIATIVIAAINPIEQANRASDAGMKADASQLVSAIERYYTSHQAFPWQITTPGTYTSSDIAFDFQSAAVKDVGLCGDASCSTTGELITSNELQNAFLNKTFIKTTAADNKLYVGKASGASSTVFVCWVPKALSNRQTLITNKKVVNLSAGFGATGAPTTTTSCDSGPSDTDWKVTGALPGCAECVPE